MVFYFGKIDMAVNITTVIVTIKMRKILMLFNSMPGFRIRVLTGALINNSRQIRKTKARAN